MRDNVVITVDAIEVGDAYDIETESRHYTLERREDGFYITGHPVYCGIATLCTVLGSAGSALGVLLRPGEIAVGERLVFTTKEHRTGVITTEMQAINRIEEVPC